MLNRFTKNTKDNKTGSKKITMTTLMLHLMMTEVSPLIKPEIAEMKKVHQRKLLNTRREERERDQLKRMIKKPNQSNKKNSLISGKSKKTSQHLTMSSQKKIAKRKRRKQAKLQAIKQKQSRTRLNEKCTHNQFNKIYFLARITHSWQITLDITLS